MLSTTRDAIKSILAADPSVDTEARRRMLKSMEVAQRPPEEAREPESRILRRKEVARRLSCSLRTVDNLATSGVLKRVALPGRERALGFNASDVEALLK